MKRWLPLVAAGGMVLAACTDSTQPRSPAAPEFQSVQGQQQQANHIHIMLRRPDVAARARGGHKGGGGGRGTGIYYHGGPVIYQTNVAAIYWSGSTIYAGGPAPNTHGSGTGDGSLVGYFLNKLGGSPYFAINTTYYDGSSTHVQNVVNYSQYWADGNGPASGATVSDAAVQQEIIDGFNSENLTYEGSTLYIVFSGPGVNLGGGFGTQYCAYHGHFTSGYGDVKYAVMPYAHDTNGCSVFGNTSPNDDPAADAEVNVIAHETEETTTDGDLNAWYDHRGYENADKCAWNFGQTYTTANGSTANMQLPVGGKDFLVQQNWVNAGNGGCALSY